MSKAPLFQLGQATTCACRWNPNRPASATSVCRAMTVFYLQKRLTYGSRRWRLELDM